MVSPIGTHTEVEEKVADWLNAGTLMVWIVNPRRRTIAVYRSLSHIKVLTTADTLDSGEVISGFGLADQRGFLICAGSVPILQASDRLDELSCLPLVFSARFPFHTAYDIHPEWIDPFDRFSYVFGIESSG